MVDLVCDVRLIGRQQRICGSLESVSGDAFKVKSLASHTRHSEQRVGFRSHPDTYHCRVGLIVYFRFPVVNLILLGNG